MLLVQITFSNQSVSVVVSMGDVSTKNITSLDVMRLEMNPVCVNSVLNSIIYLGHFRVAQQVFHLFIQWAGNRDCLYTNL